MKFAHPTNNIGPVGFRFGQKYPWTPYFIWNGLAGKPHRGLDILCPVNTPLISVARIQQARVFTDQVPGGKQHPDYGRCIYAYCLDDPTLLVIYAHLMAVGIPRVGKIWQKGEVLGWSGNTGKSSYRHLHFETRRNDQVINPEQFLG